MKYLEYTRSLKIYYSQFWEEKESHRNLKNHLSNLEEHYLHILSPRVRRLNLIVSKRSYTTYIKKEIEKASRRLRLIKNRIRFINSKINL